MFCEFCGASLKDGAKFCPNCGTPVAGDIPASAPESTYSAPASEPSAYGPSAFANGNPNPAPAAETPKPSDKLYYPDPQRYTRFMGFKEMAAMNRADDIDDFPND